jgi:hypothetical protein
MLARAAVALLMHDYQQQDIRPFHASLSMFLCCLTYISYFIEEKHRKNFKHYLKLAPSRLHHNDVVPYMTAFFHE